MADQEVKVKITTDATAAIAGIQTFLSEMKTVGTKTDAEFDAMRQHLQKTYASITQYSTASANEIRRAQEATAEKIKSINTQQYGEQTSMLEGLKKNWIAATVAIAAAMVVINKAAEFIELGAKAQQAEDSFKRVAESSGESADKILENMKRATAGTVDDSDLMQRAVKGMMLGLSGDTMVKIAEMARLGARVAGTSVAEAIEGITNSIATGMPRALKQYGLALGPEVKIITAAQTAGVEGINLMTLAQINFNIELARYGALQADANEQIQVFKAQANETWETIGKGLIIGLQKLSAVLQGAAGDFLYLYGGLMKFYGGMAELESKLTTGAHSKQMAQLANSYKMDAEAAFAASEDLHKKAMTNITGTAGTGNAGPAADAQARVAQLEKEKKAFLQNVKDQTEGVKVILKSELDSYKKTYEMEVEMADHAQKMKVLLGENELNFTLDTINTKEDALNKLYELETTSIEKNVKNEKSRQAQLDVVYADYNKQWQKYEDQKEEKTIQINNAIRDSSGQMYMAINQYSQESTDFKIAEIQRLAAQKTITSSGGVAGNEVVVAQWEADQIVKIYAAKDTAMATADLAMWKEINSHSMEVGKLQVTLWEAQTAEYIRLGHEKGLVEDWLQAKKNQYDQDWLQAEINFYSQLKGYEEEYRTYKLEWIDREEQRLAALYKDDLAAFKWAQQEKLKLNTELSKSNTASATTKNPNVGEYTGLPVGPSSGGMIINGRAYSYQAGQQYLEQLNAAYQEAQTKAIADAKAAADAIAQAAQAVADAQAAIAAKNIDLSIQILELSGQSEAALTAKRLLELSTMDESSQLLQRRIYYLQDEAKAAEAAAKAADELAKAQDAAVQSWKGQISTLISQGQAIKDFINSLGATGVSMSLSAARGAYMADLAGAQAGDETSYGRITQSAGTYISTATKTAGSSTDLARIIAGIKGELSGLAPVVGLDANIELLKLIEKNTSSTATATQRLDIVGIKAIFDLSQVITFVANSIGIPDDLRKLITDQTKDYQVWLKAQLDSSVSEDLKRVLIDGAGIYAAVVKATLGTIDSASYKLAITTMGDYTTRVNAALNIIDPNSRKLALTAAGDYYTTVLASLGITDAASKKLALDAQGNYLTTVNAALGITDPASKKLALDAAGSYLATVIASIGTIDSASQKLAITALGAYQATVNAAMGLTDESSKKLALTAAGLYLSTVNASLGIVDADSRKLALTATGTYQTTINAAMGIADTESRKLALTAVGTYLTTVNAVIGTVNADARALGLTATNTLNATINAALGIVNADAKKFALNTTNTLAATITASMGAANADAMKLGLTASNTLAATVTASLGFTDPSAVKLAMQTANQLAATVTAALGSGDANALKLATTQANTFQTTVSAALATDASTAQLQKLLTGAGLSSTTINGSLIWNPNDPLKSVFDAILAQTSATASHTEKMLVASVQKTTDKSYWSPDTRVYDYMNRCIGGMAPQYFYAPASGTLYFSDGTTKAWAEGGVFTNGIVSQPTMFNQALMGEKGPEAIMPLVRGPQGLGVRAAGGDNVISIEELRKIRASIEAGNLASVKNGNKIAKILARFDDDGVQVKAYADLPITIVI